MSNYTVINEHIENIVQTSMSIGQMSGSENFDVNNMRTAIRDMEGLIDSLQEYIIRLEEDYNDLALEALIQELGFNG